MGGIRRNGKTILGDIMNERKPVVFCVDDEESIREVYSYSLEGSFDAHCFQNENELFAALKNATPDVILLDVMLEGTDGFEILKRIKSTFCRIRTSELTILNTKFTWRTHPSFSPSRNTTF